MAKQILKSFLLFLVLLFTLILLYKPICHLCDYKFLWEYVSIFSLAFALFISFWTYFRKKEFFFLWSALWLTALFIRDWHYWELDWPYVSSSPYYILIALGVGAGWPKRALIIEKLKQSPLLVFLLSSTFFFYLMGYLCDHGAIHHFSPELDFFEGYLEESTEAMGSFFLLLYVLFARQR